jgi:MYXO-CTERM domain-containing protein
MWLHLSNFSPRRDRIAESWHTWPMRTFRIALPLLTFGLLLVASRPAAAIEVMCMSPVGECTVSNDGFDSVECSCEDVGFGGTGGDEYQGLDEAALMEICLDQLMFCDGAGGTEDGTGETGDWGDTGDMGGTDVGEETGDGDGGEGMGDGDGDGDDNGGDGDGDGDSADGSGDGDGDGDGDSGDGDGDSGDGDGDSGDGDGDAGDGDGDSGDGDGDTAGDTNTDDEGNSEGSDDGGTGTGTDTGATEDGAGGCSCDATSQGPGLALLMFSLLGLVRLRRRESFGS